MYYVYVFFCCFFSLPLSISSSGAAVSQFIKKNTLTLFWSECTHCHWKNVNLDVVIVPSDDHYNDVFNCVTYNIDDLWITLLKYKCVKIVYTVQIMNTQYRSSHRFNLVATLLCAGDFSLKTVLHRVRKKLIGD